LLSRGTPFPNGGGERSVGRSSNALAQLFSKVDSALTATCERRSALSLRSLFRDGETHGLKMHSGEAPDASNLRSQCSDARCRFTARLSRKGFTHLKISCQAKRDKALRVILRLSRKAPCSDCPLEAPFTGELKSLDGTFARPTSSDPQWHFEECGRYRCPRFPLPLLPRYGSVVTVSLPALQR